MSLTLPQGALVAPHHNQLEEGDDDDNPHQYRFYAYQHKHGKTWFGGTRRDPGRLQIHGGFVHYIRSAVKQLAIPTKMDQYIAAINFDMYIDLMRKELAWWEDRDRKMGELLQANPGQDQRLFHKPAAKYAHRLLARREGKEHELGPTFDIDDYFVGDAD